MPCRNVADIAPDHFFLAQRLTFMLPGAVIEGVMNHRAAAIVPQAGGRHRRSLQVAPQILDAGPGPPDILHEVYLPVPAVLCLEITPPLTLIADVAHARQSGGHDPVVTAAKQADDRTPPDDLDRYLYVILSRQQARLLVLRTSRLCFQTVEGGTIGAKVERL